MFRSRGRRERTEWVGGNQVAPVVVAANNLQGATLLSLATLEEWPGGRIDKCIGSIFFSPATAPAVASGYGIFFGFTLVGPFEQLDPETNLDHRWLHWGHCFPQIGGTAAADSNASRWIGYFRFDIHDRWRRRFQDDQQLNLYVKNSVSSAASIQFSYSFRFLIAAGRK